MNDRVILKHTADVPGLTYDPLTWHREEHPVLGTQVISVCEKGHQSWLSAKGHTVTEDGTVSPSYVCPVDGCGWHVWVRLDGWSGALAS